MSAESIGDMILELGAEELPAGQIVSISNHIKDKLCQALNDAEIAFKEIENHYTPRRLLWSVVGLALEAQDKELEIKGPPEKIAKDDDGSFTQAALGFAKKNNLKQEDLYFKDGYLYAKQSISGRTAKLVLEEAIPEIIANTPGIRFMRWGDGDIKFARPIQWIAALIISGKSRQVLDIEIEGLKADSSSYGHRFLAPEAFEIESSEKFINQLESKGVYLDMRKRQQRIIEQSNKLAKSVKGEIILDNELIEEIALITENPTPILCNFDKSFLEIPDPVLQTVMIHHQRYIPIASKDKLLPYFIAVSNNPLANATENIKAGNEKVIVPRFKDAEFFVLEDAKLKLEDRLSKLEGLNSLKGNILQKSHRLEKIVSYIIDELKPYFNDNPAREPGDSLDDKSAKAISRAALLSKCDLSTSLVFEFTELQGEVGGIYAAKEDLDETIVQAISEHYKPRFAGDDPPRSIGAKVLAIADKIDNIVAAFALGKIPSGSADPFALRRQANGLLEIIIHGQLIINTDSLVDHVIKLQRDEFGDGEMITKIKGRGDKRKEVQVPELNWNGTDTLVKDFLTQRLPFVFEIYHTDPEVNKAVLALGNPLAELNKRHMMIHLLNGLKAKKEFAKFVEAVTRVTNIAKADSEVQRQELLKQIDTGLFEGNYESKFFEAIKPLDQNGSQDHSYTPVLEAKQLFNTIKPINEFFDNVMVNTDDKKIQSNRQALVGYASSIFNEIGDFSLL